MRSYISVSVLALLAICQPAARAGTISVNFSAGTWYLTPTEQAGIVPAIHWNNIDGGSGSSLSLNDASGAATTALLTFNSAGAYPGNTAPVTGAAGTNTIYEGSIYGDNATREVSITVSNIPYAAYSVYVYASQDTTVQSTLSMSDGPVTYYYLSDGSRNSSATSLLLTTSTDPANPTFGPAQYQVFSGLTASTLNLNTGGSINGSIANAVFGLQIVQVVPEPFPVLSLAGGLGLLALARIRRAK